MLLGRLMLGTKSQGVLPPWGKCWWTKRRAIQQPNDRLCPAMRHNFLKIEYSPSLQYLFENWNTLKSWLIKKASNTCKLCFLVGCILQVIHESQIFKFFQIFIFWDACHFILRWWLGLVALRRTFFSTFFAVVSVDGKGERLCCGRGGYVLLCWFEW